MIAARKAVSGPALLGLPWVGVARRKAVQAKASEKIPLTELLEVAKKAAAKGAEVRSRANPVSSVHICSLHVAYKAV